MAKSFSCRDLGMQCNFQARADTEQALLNQISAHTRAVHKMQTIDDALMSKIRSVIKDA